MSQKKEKYARNLVRRMDLLEARMGDISQPSSLPDRRISAARRRAARAERDAAIWRMVAIAAALCAIVSAIAALAAVQSSARAAKPETAASTLAVQVLAVPESPENPAANREAQLMPWANKIEDCLVTHYDTCTECCGKTDGVTASGVQATPGVTVAVDPAVIPLGANVLVDYGDGELHRYRAEDTGAVVVGNTIDLCVSSHEEALKLGRRTASAYWMASEEGMT